MTKGLKTLIKMQQRALDELKREQVRLEEQKEQLLAVVTKLQSQMLHERELASQQPDLMASFVSYADRVKKRQQEILKEVMVIDHSIAAVTDKITECFSELKKYEIAKEMADQREVAKQAKREQQELDEIGARKHRTRQQGEDTG